MEVVSQGHRLWHETLVLAMSQVVKGVPLRYQRGSLDIRDLPLGGGDFEWNAGAALAGLAMGTALGDGEAPVRVHRQGSHHPPLIHRFRQGLSDSVCRLPRMSSRNKQEVHRETRPCIVGACYCSMGADHLRTMLKWRLRSYLGEAWALGSI